MIGDDAVIRAENPVGQVVKRCWEDAQDGNYRDAERKPNLQPSLLNGVDNLRGDMGRREGRHEPAMVPFYLVVEKGRAHMEGTDNGGDHIQ